MHLEWDGNNFFVDLGAEAVLAAEKGLQKIAVYLAVPQFIVEGVFQEPLGQIVLEDSMLRVIGFDPVEEAVTAWIP